MRWLAGLLAGQSSSGRNPARVASHDFHHEHFGRGAAHAGNVETGFGSRGGDVFGDTAETRAVVGGGQIVVDGFGDADTSEWVT